MVGPVPADISEDLVVPCSSKQDCLFFYPEIDKLNLIPVLLNP